jgi:hypothetical protein
LELGMALRDNGAPARSSRPAIEGRNKDIVLCLCRYFVVGELDSML